VRQFSYIFHGLPVSPYLTNGVIDPQLESRLLRVDDPSREAAEPVDFTGAREVVLSSKADETSPIWLYLEPKLTLAPGERLLLRFEFFERNYTGALLMRGPNGFYREYPLPAAGFYAKSFGVDPARPKTVALWNTGAVPQPVELVFLRAEAPADGREFGDFARVKIQPYFLERLPVRTETLIPYRARVKAAEPAWLETPRAFIPGYRASVDGRETEVVASPNNMAMFKVPALWTALGVSAATWAGLGLAWFRARRRAATAA
jgi:hypothetical protein